MTAKRYYKTGTVMAEQYDQSAEMSDHYGIKHVRTGYDAGGTYTYAHRIHTLEGDLDVTLGDWILTGPDGEHWPVKDSIFRKTYVAIPSRHPARTDADLPEPYA